MVGDDASQEGMTGADKERDVPAWEELRRARITENTIAIGKDLGRSGSDRLVYHLGGRAATQAGGHRNGRGTARNIHGMKRENNGRTGEEERHATVDRG